MKRVRIPAEVQLRVRKIASDRCGYCRSPQRLVLGRLQIEHIVPLSKGGTNDESNLWLSCSPCNLHKSDKLEVIDPLTGRCVRLFNPRTQIWKEHFQWSVDGTCIEGLTETGRATVIALHLCSDENALQVRHYWVLAGWHPPKD